MSSVIYRLLAAIATARSPHRVAHHHRFHHDRSQPIGRVRARRPAPWSAPKNRPRAKAATDDRGIPNPARACTSPSFCGANSRRPRCPWSRSRLALAVREAILKATDLACDLRWPNDVLIESKKCAGILTMLEGSAIIAGIGINVNHSPVPG